MCVMQHVRKAKLQPVNSDLIMVRRENSRGLLEVSTGKKHGAPKIQMKRCQYLRKNYQNKKKSMNRIKFKLGKYFLQVGMSIV